MEPSKPDVSGLVELPEGWVWASVEQTSEAIVGGTSTAEFKASGFACVDTNSIKVGKIVHEELRYVDEATFIDRNRRMKPQADDVLFSGERRVIGDSCPCS